jgi:hypothetical protein
LAERDRLIVLGEGEAMSDKPSTPLRLSLLRRWAVRSAALTGLGIGFWLAGTATASADVVTAPVSPVISGLVPTVTDAGSTLTAPLARHVVEPVRAQVAQPLVEHVIEPVVDPVHEWVTDPLVERVVEPAVTPIVDTLDPVVLVTGPVDVVPAEPTGEAVAAAVPADGTAAGAATATSRTAHVAVGTPDAVRSNAAATSAPPAPAPAPPAPAPAPLPAVLPASSGTAGSSSAGADGATAVPIASAATPVPAALRVPGDTGRADAVDAVVEPSFSPD